MISKSNHPAADILIVDDMPDNLHILSQTLKRFGYKVRAVMDGELAIAAAQAAVPDLIMLDVDMPGMDGYETCRRLKADVRTADAPVIFISALGEVNDKIKAFQVGGVDYVTKPFHIEEVQARIETHLALRKLSLELESTNLMLELHLAELNKARKAEHEQRLLAETLRDSIAALNSSLNYEEVLNLILDNLGKVVPHHSASLAVLDENGMVQVERTRGYTEEEGVALCNFSHIPARSHYLWRRVIETHQPVFIPDTAEDAEWAAQPLLPWARSFACAPTIIKENVIGFLNLESRQPGFFTQAHIWQLQAFADQAAVAIDKARLFDETQRLAITDGLTGIFNHRHLMQLCDHEYERSRRFHHQLGIIMADIDHFKMVNDTYGHPVGDGVLKSLANLFMENLRTVDLLGRYGGEEFMVLLPETNFEQAMAAAERLRMQVEQAYHRDASPVAITISLGVASTEANNNLTLSALIKLADDALYIAKNAGRNQVVGLQPPSA